MKENDDTSCTSKLITTALSNDAMERKIRAQAKELSDLYCELEEKETLIAEFRQHAGDNTTTEIEKNNALKKYCKGAKAKITEYMKKVGIWPLYRSLCL